MFCLDFVSPVMHFILHFKLRQFPKWLPLSPAVTCKRYVICHLADFVFAVFTSLLEIHPAWDALFLLWHVIVVFRAFFCK